MSPFAATWCTQCCSPLAVVAPAPPPALAVAAVASPGVSVAPPPVSVAPSIPLAAEPPYGGIPQQYVAAPLPEQPISLNPAADGRLLDRRALTLVVGSIGIGALVQVVALALSHIHSIEPETLIRYDIVLTLGLYAAVTVLIVRQITPAIRLRWGEGPLVARIAVGAAVGIGVSLVLLALVSSASGHLQSDPRITLLMSEGDPTHIIVTVFIGCLAAPLVEETLFRGLLLESLLPRGTKTAILVSACGFAIWHFMPASLIYYTALGAALGKLYLKRGLAGSIAAHVGFNGVLTIAAIVAVLTPSQVLTVGGMHVTVPRGWSQHAVAAAGLPDTDVFLLGPSDAELDIAPGPTVGRLDPQAIAQWMRTNALPSTAQTFVDTGSVRELAIPAGTVVEENVTVQGRAGTIAVVDLAGQLDEFVFFGAGSARATADFNGMLNSLQAA